MKKRQELPNFLKIKQKVDIDKILKVYNDNIKSFEDKKDFLNLRYGVPYVSENGYTQIPVTKFSESATGDIGDERNYRELEQWAKGTYIEDVTNLFSESTRIRFCVISSGGFIKPHIDYNTDYSVRYQIPITTNDWSYVGVQRKGEKPEVKHLEADGSVWFMNQGYNHSAWNMGKTDRVHLIVCVNGQEEL